jgi:hypothetical protein
MREYQALVAKLREAVDQVETELSETDPDPTALEGLKSTLDSARTSILALLSATGPGDFQGMARKLRLRRAAQVCQNVLSAMVDGRITGGTPGYSDLMTTVTESLERLAHLRGPNT